MGPIHLTSRPTLREPILIAAFRGWNDGGTAATIAAAFLKNHLHAERFGEIDSDGFVDYQQTRPQVTIEEGHVRQITWPETEFFHARLPNGERDILLVIGVEPNFRWREFSRSIAQLAQELGCIITAPDGKPARVLPQHPLCCPSRYFLLQLRPPLAQLRPIQPCQPLPQPPKRLWLCAPSLAAAAPPLGQPPFHRRSHERLNG